MAQQICVCVCVCLCVCVCDILKSQRPSIFTISSKYTENFSRMCAATGTGVRGPNVFDIGH